jgi:transposase
MRWVDQDPDLKSHVDNVVTLEGVGFMTVVQAAAETWGFDQFTNTKQLTSFTGLDVVIRQSGNRSRRASVSKRGNGMLRQLMFMPALTAIRCNPHLRAFYLRLVERKKNKMIALIAVARKLLCLIFTLWKKNVPYDLNYNRNVQPALA